MLVQPEVVCTKTKQIQRGIMYRLVYRKGLKLNEAMDEITERCKTQPELKIFLDSLRSSDRGLIR